MRAFLVGNISAGEQIFPADCAPIDENPLCICTTKVTYFIITVRVSLAGDGGGGDGWYARLENILASSRLRKEPKVFSKIIAFV